MVNLEIIRLEESAEHGTFGVLKINKSVYCCTLEPSDRLNKTNQSSIPAKQYKCNKIISPKYGTTYQVMDVPDRTHILFHAGNIDDHTEGCIILGQHFGKLRGNKAVLNSGKTFMRFMELLKDEKQLHLSIGTRYC